MTINLFILFLGKKFAPKKMKKIKEKQLKVVSITLVYSKNNLCAMRSVSKIKIHRLLTFASSQKLKGKYI
jgi:hypothetical protein